MITQTYKLLLSRCIRHSWTCLSRLLCMANETVDYITRHSHTVEFRRQHTTHGYK